jgi:hypothetical protein
MIHVRIIPEKTGECKEGRKEKQREGKALDIPLKKK